jgi:streptogramin lyase
MFSRFMPLALIRGSRNGGAVQPGCRTRPTQRRPDGTRARFQLEGLEDRSLLSGVSAITEYNAPSFGVGSNTWGITAGADGNLWFTEQTSNRIGVINPTTDAISEFVLPTTGSYPRGITAGPDGNLWFTEFQANKIGMINPTTDAISEFVSGGGPQDIASGPDGNLWFTEYGANKIGMINPTTHAVSEFSVPTRSSFPWGIAAGPDGNLWFTEYLGGKVGMINPTTHAISEFPVPNAVNPQEIAKGPDGNLWFGENNKIGEINPATDVITQFTRSVGGGIYGLTAGPDGNVWFAVSGYRNIARINPTTGAITDYPARPPMFQPWGITTGPDGNLWTADFRPQASVGVATLATSELVVTQPPPASVAAGSPFGLTVQAQDSSGNVITTFNGTVTVALGDDSNYNGSPTLGGTLTVTASNGVATFSNLTLSNAGYYFSLYTSGGGLGWGVTNTISVTPGAATQVVITQQPPATVKVNSGFGLQASIEDQFGNLVTTATNAVSVSFANNPTGATLGGTLTVTASQGVATFSGLTINKIGSGYTLNVSSSGLSSAVTSPINATKTGKSAIVVAQGAVTAPDPLLAPLVLDSPDLWDNVGLKRRTRRN